MFLVKFDSGDLFHICPRKMPDRICEYTKNVVVSNSFVSGLFSSHILPETDQKQIQKHTISRSTFERVFVNQTKTGLK